MKTAMLGKVKATALVALAGLFALACGGEKDQVNRRGGLAPQDDVDDDTRGDDDARPKPKKKKQGGNGGGGDGGPVDDEPIDTPIGDDPTEIQKLQSALGLKNWDQINYTMSTLTGVPATTASVRTVFEQQLKTSLPTENDVKGFIGSQQVAVFKLAVEYCDALTRDAALRAAFMPGFNFGATPAVAFDAAGKAAVADVLVTKLWGMGLSTLPPHDESVQMAVALIDDILVGKNMGAAAVTPAIVAGACTALLSSAAVTLY